MRDFVINFEKLTNTALTTPSDNQTLNFKQRRALAEHFLKQLCCHYIGCDISNGSMFDSDVAYFLDRLDKRYPHID